MEKKATFFAFCSPFNLSHCRNALPYRNLRITVTLGPRLKGMGSEMCSSNLRMPTVDCSEQSGNSIFQEDAVELVAYEEIRSIPGKLDSMTVRELRTLTRTLGISTKGTKQQLLSSLRCYSAKGKTSMSEDMEMPSAVQNAPLNKRDAAHLGSECDLQDPDAVSDVPENKQRRTRRRNQMVDSTIAEDDSKTVTEQVELSIKAEKVTGTRKSSSIKQVSSKIQIQQQKLSNQIVIPVERPEPWTVLAHKKPQKEWIPYNPKTMRPPPPDDDKKFMKLVSWNVNGLRALLKLESFSALQLAQKENFDVLCLQETKLQEKDVDAIKNNLIDGYNNNFWTCSVSKLGYSGTAVISRIKPISVNYGLGILDHDTEGRIVTVEFDSFYLISGYVPNSGDGLRRLSYRVEQWDPSLSNYMKELEKSKPVILTGDLNCAHEEIDIYDPAGNRRSAGFTYEERESFQKNFLSRGFVDTFRRQHPGVVAYTYWGYRHGGRKVNKGWRLDYFLVSEAIADKIHDSYILPHVTGSDHCPVGLIFKF